MFPELCKNDGVQMDDKATVLWYFAPPANNIMRAVACAHYIIAETKACDWGQKRTSTYTFSKKGG